MTTWSLDGGDSQYVHAVTGARWPRVSAVVAEWSHCAMPAHIPRRVLEEAAAVGTWAHAAIASAYFGCPPRRDLPPVEEAQKRQLARLGASFSSWAAAFSPRAVLAEVPLPATSLEVVGTPDFIGAVEGEEGPGVVDWKTGSLISLASEIALAVYCEAAIEAGHDIRWARIVRLEKGEDAPGYEERRFTLEDLAPHLETFRLLRQLHKRRIEETA